MEEKNFYLKLNAFKLDFSTIFPKFHEKSNFKKVQIIILVKGILYLRGKLFKR